MNNTIKIVIAVLVVLLAAGVVWLVASETREDDTSSEVVNGEEEVEHRRGPEFATDSEIAAHIEGGNLGDIEEATAQDSVEVTIDDNIFNPTVLTVSVGTTVTWVHNGNMQHDVVSANGSPRGGLSSPLLSRGESYTFTFDEPGTYLYICQPHSSEMRAVIEVVE